VVGLSGPEFAAQRMAGRVLAPPGADIVLAEWTAEGAPGGQPRYQAPLHRHGEDEAWYVLSGTLTVRMGNNDVRVPAGGAALVPGGIAHTYWNPGAEPARYLLVMGTRTYGLIQALHATADRDRDATRALFQEFGAELLD
jgi:mannose-6-phosphate isomerase-like protein (cupin superfamily)